LAEPERELGVSRAIAAGALAAALAGNWRPGAAPSRRCWTAARPMPSTCCAWPTTCCRASATQ
jgi:hypothetical protein